jgi:hypothetical protein
MGRKLLSLAFGTGLALLGANAYAQSSPDEIPAFIKKQAVNYLKYAPTSDTIPELSIVLNQTNKDLTGDGVADKLIIYSINNKSLKEWHNIPNGIRYQQDGLKEGGFARGTIESISTRRDGKGNLPENWWVE